MTELSGKIKTTVCNASNQKVVWRKRICKIVKNGKCASRGVTWYVTYEKIYDLLKVIVLREQQNIMALNKEDLDFVLRLPETVCDNYFAIPFKNAQALNRNKLADNWYKRNKFALGTDQRHSVISVYLKKVLIQTAGKLELCKHCTQAVYLFTDTIYGKSEYAKE